MPAHGHCGAGEGEGGARGAEQGRQEGGGGRRRGAGGGGGGEGPAGGGAKHRKPSKGTQEHSDL